MHQHLPTIATVMTPFPETIEGDRSLQDAHDLMTSRQIRHLVVTRQHDVSGVISERDIEAAQAHFGKGSDRELLVDDICPVHTFTADIHDPLEEILEVMASKRLGTAVILKNGELAGILTASDACKHFAKLLRELKSDPPPVVA